MNASALKREGDELLNDYHAAFADLPEDAPIKQPAEWPPGSDGALVPHWLGFLEHVLEHGPPVDAKRRRFSIEVYGLPDTIAASDICIQSVSGEATFFGNYPAPDDLDGQTIDLVATHTPAAAQQLLKISPRNSPLTEQLGSIAEIQELQRRSSDRTTLGSLGLLPLEIATLPAGQGMSLHRGQIPGVHPQEMSSVGKPAEQKAVLSDHTPIAFNACIQSKSAAAGAPTEKSFSVMSMNMLASEYLPFSFWNSEPKDEMRNLWLLASRLRACADRKTKWLPKQYSSMCRTNSSEEELSNAEDSPLVRWECLNRRFFKWVAVVQKQAFQGQVGSNPFAHDHVRLGVLAQLLMNCEEAERPDLLFLQEVGMSELKSEDFLGNDDSSSFPVVGFSQKLANLYPALRPLLHCYQVVNASPKLNVRRGGVPQTTDIGLVLAKKSVMETYSFEPITSAAREKHEKLKELYIVNAGKPIVGVRVLDQQGRSLANLFGVHFEKGKAQQILEELFAIVQGSGEECVPAFATGDFNAVLKTSPLAA